MLKCTNIRKSYPGFTLDCSFTVPSGRISGLIGANGAGKSTAFKAILGLVRRDSGTLSLFGEEKEALSEEDKRRLGVVLADAGYNPYLTVEDTILIQKAFYPAFREDFFRQKCQELDLPLQKLIKDFSTGMKAKLRVLCAVSHDADLLILDEPTAGLDVLARDQILDLLRDFMAEKEERSVLISSHISADLETLCDDFYMIDRGKIFFHEETDRLLSEYGILKVTEEELQQLDLRYIRRKRKESWGYSLLCDQKRYYFENCPGITIEKAGIDELIMMMLKGEEI
ncbi:MAG: ABC transporter ATP-binding protein [Erysipelotrichaceae bacterium]|nr:ABC transporter ATP-binding protein [Erysipelotrichaceae bacterium]